MDTLGQRATPIHSLVAFKYMDGLCQVASWTETAFLLRMHIGLEEPDDLIQAIESEFDAII